jgi:hypothetical protein
MGCDYHAHAILYHPPGATIDFEPAAAAVNALTARTAYTRLSQEGYPFLFEYVADRYQDHLDTIRIADAAAKRIVPQALPFVLEWLTELVEHMRLAYLGEHDGIGRAGRVGVQGTIGLIACCGDGWDPDDYGSASGRLHLFYRSGLARKAGFKRFELEAGSGMF